jgi:hypothetical protein
MASGPDDFQFKITKDGEDDWEVALPHRCDDWVIGSGTHEEVMASMLKFVGEVGEAYGKLKRKVEQPQDWF